MIDNTKALGLQSIFSAGRREALEPLAEECRRIAYQVAGKYQSLGRERRAEIAHDAAARLVERYLRNPDYRVRSFSRMLRTEVRHALTNGGHSDRPSAVIERTMASLDETQLQDERKAESDPRTYAEDLQSDHARGEQILLDLYRATTYRGAILAISAYVERRWIYDHSVQLRTVYRMTRRKKT